MPAYGSTRRNASAIIVASRDTLAQLPRRYREKAVYIPENAIDPARFECSVSNESVRLPLKLAFIGRLVPYKGADMLLEAAAPLVRAGRARVDVIGDGPMRPDLERLIEREELGEGVTLHGWIEHARVQERLASCDVLAFPSIREFGGGVVLEAMAVGLVPIIVDYAGPAELVTGDTGYRVPLGSRATIIGGFRQVLERLADDPSEVRAMGSRGRARALEHFTWSAKAKQVLEVWRWIAGSRADKPDFGFPLGGPSAERVIGEGVRG
jgi:glycosyltransferase involved in cell wall biosynthesis